MVGRKVIGEDGVEENNGDEVLIQEVKTASQRKYRITKRSSCLPHLTEEAYGSTSSYRRNLRSKNGKELTRGNALMTTDKRIEPWMSKSLNMALSPIALRQRPEDSMEHSCLQTTWLPHWPAPTTHLP
jgi:hypothetical protein